MALKTYIYTNPAFPPHYGKTIVATGTDKTDAVERIQKFIKGKGLKIKVDQSDVWQLNEEVPQAAFVCGD